MQFLAGLAGDFSEPRLDIHMHIFECCAPHKAIVRDLLYDSLKAVDDCIAIRLADDSTGLQHQGMRPRTSDVVFREPAVKMF